MSDKQFISAQSLLEDSWRLAVSILKDRFHPNFIVGVWRGGTPVGIAVQEMLDFYGVHTDHISIRTSSYSGKSRLEAPDKYLNCKSASQYTVRNTHCNTIL